MKKRIVVLILAMVLTMGLLVGCDDGMSQSTSTEKTYTEDLMNQALSSVGLPNVSNYFERAQLKTIYELRDDPKLNCFWYTKNDMTGKWIFQGKCIGYGIPYSTQMTNPDTVQTGGSSSSSGYWGSTICQAEPNGLYSTGSTNATWILTVSSDGSIKPTYVESEVTVSQVKVEARLCESWSLVEGY